MTVDIFIPCFIDQFYPKVGFQMVKVLELIGCTVNYNPDQTCCGQPAYNAGKIDLSRKVAAKFLSDFNVDRKIIVPSGSCVGFVKNHYAKIFENHARDKEIEKLTGNIRELSEFMVKDLNIDNINARFAGKAVYHDACGALRELGIKNEPRKLLEKVKDLEMIEMDSSETCCGFGGGFSTKFESISVSMAESKRMAIEATGADYVISTDASCFLHLENYLKKKGSKVKCVHIAEVLSSGN